MKIPGRSISQRLGCVGADCCFARHVWTKSLFLSCTACESSQSGELQHIFKTFADADDGNKVMACREEYENTECVCVVAVSECVLVR